MPLKVHALAVALVVDGEEAVDVVEGDAGRCSGGRSRRDGALRGGGLAGRALSGALSGLRVHHRDHADLVAVARGLHGVLVAVGGQRQCQAALAEDVVVRVLVVGLRLGVAPLLKVLAVPHDGVAVRAVRRLNGQEAHREVLPDGLAQVDVRHHPARQHLGVAVVHAGDEDHLLLGLRRVGGEPELSDVSPAELVTVHRGHHGVIHQVTTGEVLNCNGHFGRKEGLRKGRKGRNAGRREGRAAVEAQHSANTKIGYSIFSDFCILSKEYKMKIFQTLCRRTVRRLTARLLTVLRLTVRRLFCLCPRLPP